MKKMGRNSILLRFFLSRWHSSLLSCCSVLLLSAHGDRAVGADFGNIFDKYPQSAFVMLDVTQNSYIRHNPEQCKRRFLPASTFKVMNSLIALETGVAPNEHFSLRWDGTPQRVKSWNRDHTLESAFKNSVVWFYTELAQRIGHERIKQFLDKIGYGNGDIRGSRTFWLNGHLKISSDEQVRFLYQLYKGDLPFSKHAIQLVKQFMIVEESDTFILRGKTGWADSPSADIGWFVGWLEQDQNAYIFATNIVSRDTSTFAKDRIKLTRMALKKLGLMR